MVETFQQVKGASLVSMASSRTDRGNNESRNQSDQGDTFSVSTSKRTQKQTMADVQDNGFNLVSGANSSEEDETKNPEYWVDFYKSNHD